MDGDVSNTKTKECSKCGLVKSVEEFQKHKGTTDGKHPWCKVCCSEYQKEYSKKNKEKRREYNTNWVEKNRDKVNLDAREYYHKNIQKVKDRRSKNYQKNNDRFRQYEKECRVKQNLRKWDILDETELKLLESKKKALFKTWKDRLPKSENFGEAENGKILIKCLYCKTNFTPTNLEIFIRYKRIKLKKQKHLDLFCSSDCRCRLYLSSRAKYRGWWRRLTVDESPKKDADGFLLVKCTYCGKYFNPTHAMVKLRVSALEGRATSGEARLYCSDGCKSACPIFHRQTWPRGYKKASSREVDPLIRQMCLERDNYTCQKCGRTIDEIELHCHHIEGAVRQPMLANDVDNTITLCKKCHKWVHKQKDCTYYDLRCKK